MSLKSILLLLVSILFTILSVWIVSHKTKKPNLKQIHREYTVNKYNKRGTTIELYNFNGCEYMGHLYGSADDWVTHRGDCSNPIHKLNKDTIIIKEIKIFLIPTLNRKKQF